MRRAGEFTLKMQAGDKPGLDPAVLWGSGTNCNLLRKVFLNEQAPSGIFIIQFMPDKNLPSPVLIKRIYHK